MENKITEIVLGSYSGYFNHKRYEDELTIKEYEISYEYKLFDRIPDIKRGLIQKEVKWRCLVVDSTEYPNLFNELTDALEHYKKPDIGKALDAPGFVITIKYEDGKEKFLHYHYARELSEDKPLMYILSIMQKMLPKGEQRPSLLRKRFKL